MTSTRSAPVIRALAALLLLPASFVAVSARSAQEAVSPDVRLAEQIAARQWIAAWETLERVPETPARLRMRVTVALGLDRVDAAVTAAGRLERTDRAGAREALGEIVREVGNRLRHDGDPDVRIPVCAALAGLGDRPCVTALREAASGSSERPAARLQAALAAVDAGVPNAAGMVKEAARAAIETDPVSSAAAYEHADAATAVPSLIGLLGSEQRDAQYVAAYALGEFRTPEARQALQHYLKSDETTGGRRQAATIALARLGDRDALAAVREMVPKLGGRDLLEAARALDAARDPRALAILRQVLTGDHDLLRYEAAVLIGSRDADAVRRTLTTGLTSRNPWTRIAALTAFRRLGWDVPLEGRLLLADAAPHVAAAAVAAVSRRLAAPPPRAAAEPHGA